MSAPARRSPRAQHSAANGASQITYCGLSTLPSATNASTEAVADSTRSRRASGIAASRPAIMSTPNTACTAPAGPPASPLDLKRSGVRFVPVT